MTKQERKRLKELKLKFSQANDLSQEEWGESLKLCELAKQSKSNIIHLVGDIAILSMQVSTFIILLLGLL
jgi:hypothetical protein